MDDTPEQAPARVSSYRASRRFKISNLALSLIAMAITTLIYRLELLDKIEWVTLDLRYKLRPAQEALPEIVHIDIDEESISRIGRWPWSREWYATLLAILTEYQTKIVTFDIFFSEKSPMIDFLLEEATRMARNVIFAVAFEYGETPGTPSPQGNDVMTRFRLEDSQIIGDKANIPSLAKPIKPLTDLYSKAKSAGHVIIFPDADGAVRRVPAVIECQGSYYLQLGIETALAYLDINRRQVKIVLGEHVDLGNGTRIPIDQRGFLFINWVGPWKHDFKHYSFWEVVASYQSLINKEKPGLPLEALKDKLCMVGLTATGLMDIKPVPVQPDYHIVGLHTNLVNMILKKKFIQKAPEAVHFAIAFLLTALVGLAIPKLKPLGGGLFFSGLVLSYLGISYLSFRYLGLWLHVMYPLASAFAGFTGVMTHSEIANAFERTQLIHLAIRDGLTQLYVKRHMDEVLKQEMAKAKRYRRPLSLIMADIDHFKRVNDNHGHLVGDFILKEVANLLKSTGRQSDVHGRYGGEEFVILLPETLLGEAVAVAKRLCKFIKEQTFTYNNQLKLNVTVSFGVTELKEDASVEDLIGRADQYLYVAKETGRNRVCFG